MWLDVIAIAILAVFAWLGARRGALAAGMGLFALVAGYAAAIFLGPQLAPVLGGLVGESEWAGIAVAGSLAFAICFAAVSILAFVLRRRSEVDAVRTPRDRFLGGAFGAARGAILVVLVGYLALWLDAARVTGVLESGPNVEGSMTAAVTGALVEVGVGSALDGAGPAGRVVARLAARPASALTELQAVVDSPHIAAIREDPLFWTYVETGAIDAAMNQRGFLALSHDEQMRQRLARLGIVEEAAAVDSIAFRAAAGDVLREVGRRIVGLRDDPELQKLLEDPEVVAMVQAGDTFGLMSHQGFRQLVSRLSAGS